MSASSCARLKFRKGGRKLVAAKHRKRVARREQTKRKQQRRLRKVEAHRALVRVAIAERDVRLGRVKTARGSHMHEIVPRSALRGRPLDDVFNTRNCVLLTPETHAHVTAKRIALVCTDPAYAMIDGRWELTGGAGADGEVLQQWTLQLTREK